MLFKLANNLVMALAVFYVAEGTGIIERGKYFPTLPRLEASASDPGAWFGAARWGVGQVVQLARSNDTTAIVAKDPRDLNLEEVTTFAKRLEAKRDEVIRTSIGYYGS
ncbi:MAG: hypothetical protein EON60_01705 [Alphaproteobacteria bacterium]|nr:MAG: hypothetical protein EON60_01805 [Alphaproteobacteria bacterium]RYG61914.1 MAG: hypothetical protein EON60_01705 [Alphaproteobacteria bacterium]